MKEISN